MLLIEFSDWPGFYLFNRNVYDELVLGPNKRGEFLGVFQS